MKIFILKTASDIFTFNVMIKELSKSPTDREEHIFSEDLMMKSEQFNFNVCQAWRR